MDSAVAWLLESGEPWTRYRALVDLLDRSDDAPDVEAARSAMLAHPQVQTLMAAAREWPGGPIKRHNDSGHPLHALAVLADMGVRADDPAVQPAVAAVLAHQSAEGAFQSQILIPRRFGGDDQVHGSWMACDAPTVLYALLGLGLEPVDQPQIRRALDHLLSAVDDNGWRCRVAPELGKFRGPGRKDDPCPIATLLALRALAQVPVLHTTPAVLAGVEMILGHWERQKERKIYLFGIGTDFRKLKYPLVWYDILHVVDVLSRFAVARLDPRLGEMAAELFAQADEQGCYTAASMYRPWKEWSFANKKQPSPWLTLLALRAQRRLSA